VSIHVKYEKVQYFSYRPTFKLAFKHCMLLFWFAARGNLYWWCRKWNCVHLQYINYRIGAVLCFVLTGSGVFINSVSGTKLEPRRRE